MYRFTNDQLDQIDAAVRKFGYAPLAPSELSPTGVTFGNFDAVISLYPQENGKVKIVVKPTDGVLNELTPIRGVVDNNRLTIEDIVKHCSAISKGIGSIFDALMELHV